jgi:hypothetical protein
LKLYTTILLMLFFHGCAASQHPNRTWDQDARIATNGAAHLLAGVDTAVATRYTQEQADAGNLDALDARFARVHTAETAARQALLAAEHAVDAAVNSGIAGDRCHARDLIVALNAPVHEAMQAIDEAGITVSSTEEETVTNIATAAAALAPSCGSSSP